MQIRLALVVPKSNDADSTFPLGYFLSLSFFSSQQRAMISVVLAGPTPPNALVYL